MAYLNLDIGEMIKRIRDTYESIKEKRSLKYSDFETQIDYAKTEIEIRVESIKLELDDLNVCLQKQLDDCKQELINDLKTRERKDDSIEERINEIMIESDTQRTNDLLSACFTQLNTLNEAITQLERINQPAVTFEPSTSSIDIHFLGTLNFAYRKEKEIEELNKRLRACKYEFIDVNFASSNLHALPNGHLLAASCIEQNLTLYDSCYKILKIEHTYNNRTIYPFYVTTNKSDRVYVCDSYNHRVLMLDLDLHLLHEIGTNGVFDNQFSFPCGIHYTPHDSLLYICDNQNKRVQVYNTNLVYRKTYTFDYCPFEIKCTQKYACVRDNDKSFINFYDINTFECKIKYEGHNGTIFDLHEYMYEFYSETKTVYVYNAQCEIIESIELSQLNDGHAQRMMKFNGFETICYFNGKFIISSENSKKFLAF